MNNKVNKHGLSRTIPPDVRAQIRIDAGFGCVICGTPFVDYEHIEPEFNNAHVHDPTKMTLLCTGCHGKVTGKRKSKKKVWEAKANPICKKDGFVREILEPTQEEVKVLVGNSVFTISNIILSVAGKPIIWFEPSSNSFEPILLNAIFHNEKSIPIAYVCRNIFRGLVSGSDIVGTAARLEIRPEPRNIALVLESKGDEPIWLKRLNMTYQNMNIKINKKGELKFEDGNSSFTFGGGNISGFGSGMVIGNVPATRHVGVGVLRCITLALEIGRAGIPVISFSGHRIGWVLNNLILNLEYAVVASLNEQMEVQSITNEYLGQLLAFCDVNKKITSYSVVYGDEEYSTGEPIWVCPIERDVKNIHVIAEFDLGHRLVDSHFSYLGVSKLSKYLPTPEVFGRMKEDPSFISSEKYLPVLTSAPITNGDTVTIDFEGFIDGIPFEGGKADGFELVIGSKRMISSFEEGLLGVSNGSDVIIEVTFPNDYHAESLAGKTAVFKIKVIEVYTSTSSPYTEA